MKLVDANKLKMSLEKAISKNADMDCLDFLRISSVIDAQPTAYDVDRIVKLPCKVGDTIYVYGVLGCGVAEKYTVVRVDYHSTLGTKRNEFYIEALLDNDPNASIGFYDKEFGRTVFLTKEEAEQENVVSEDEGVKDEID